MTAIDKTYYELGTALMASSVPGSVVLPQPSAQHAHDKLKEMSALLTEIYDSSAPEPHHTPVKLTSDLRGRIGTAITS